MLTGLRLMQPAELRTLGGLAGLEDRELHKLATTDALVARLMSWMGKVVGCKSHDEEAIERAVIEWMSKRWSLNFAADDDIGAMERNLRVAIAEDSAKHLVPFWEVGCAMAYVGPEDAVTPKLELMEKAASRLVPSQTARQQMRKAWEVRRSAEDTDALLATLADEIAFIKADGELVQPTLVLSLVVALADGRFGVEEEQFYERLADMLGVSHSVAEQVLKHVNSIYWDKLREVAPKRTDTPTELHETKLQALRAAHLTLETSGVMESLEDEVHSGFLGQLHQTMTKDPAFVKGMEGWNKTPLMWPIGYAAGMCLYFKSRFKASDHPNLIRIAYLAICRQHVSARPDGALLGDDAVGASPDSEHEVGKALREAALDPRDKEPVRRIKLN
ncbi:MAG: hypothetical protein KC910_00720 [Candidatus Eremiobacteraeota bacterium]|nr:hypothetical protein [Candidatus Eremiobacteraeota bacterium]